MRFPSNLNAKPNANANANPNPNPNANPTPNPTPYQAPKRLQEQDIEEQSAGKRQKTTQFSSAHPEPDEHQARGPMDIPRPPETSPQTVVPEHASLTIQSGTTLNIEDLHRIRPSGNVTTPAGGDVEHSNIVVPAGASVIPLPMLPLAFMLPQQIISVNVHAWDPALTTKILDLLVPHANPLAVELPDILRRIAKPMADQALLNKAMRTRYAEVLGALGWTHKLMRSNFRLRAYSPELVTAGIDALVDRAAYAPCLQHAPAQHTLTLMLAAGKELEELYDQLRTRKASGTNLAAHIDWNQLPVHAILVGSLALGPDSNEFRVLVATVLSTLSTFGNEVEAQVHADLCIYFDLRARQMLSELNTAEATAQLERLKHFEAAAGQYATETPVYQEHVAPLFEALPPAGAPWNLSALFALRLLTRLRKVDILTSEQVQVLTGKSAEMLRHFMSLAWPGALNHPLLEAAKFVSSTHVEHQAAFMQLSPQEKVKLLRSHPFEDTWAFLEDLIQRSSLTVPEQVRLIEDILGQQEVPFAIQTMLRARLEDLRHQAGPL